MTAGRQSSPVEVAARPAPPDATGGPPAQLAADTAPPRAAATTTPDTSARTAEEAVLVTAPSLGAFYHAPRPDLPAYVSVGSRVEPETTVGLIEAMKVFTAVTPRECTASSRSSSRPTTSSSSTASRCSASLPGAPGTARGETDPRREPRGDRGPHPAHLLGHGHRDGPGRLRSGPGQRRLPAGQHHGVRRAQPGHRQLSAP